MQFATFEDIWAAAKALDVRPRLAVAAAHDEHVLASVSRAVADGICDATLVGHADEIRKILSGLGADAGAFAIEDVDDVAEAASRAVELVRSGRADILMKGILETRDFMHAVVARDTGLRQPGRVLSTVGIFQVESYPKLVSVTDVAISTTPDLAAKRQILENGVACLHALGIARPKVAVLSAAEIVNPKLPDSQDARELMRLWEEGEIGGCYVEGPISLDLAVSPEAVAIKGYESPVAADADLLVAPDLTSANLLAKAMLWFAGATVAGLVMGGTAPIILTSRSASVQDKYNSIALAAMAAAGGRG
jgi:phosphate butyryltransferase